MQRFNDTILDRNGNPVAGVNVYVYEAGASTTLATIYDPSENTIDPSQVIANPIVTDATGRVSFAAYNGRYRIVYTGGNITNRQMDWVTMIDGSGGYIATGGLGQFDPTTSSQLAGVITDETGTGLLVFNDSPNIVAPEIDGGTILSATLTSPIIDTPTITDPTVTSGTFTGPTLVTPDLGVATATSINSTTIPSSKTLVVTTDKLSALAATSSAELAGVISDETGSGSLVFANSPVLTTPTLGVAKATSLAMDNTSGKGIKLDTASPVYGWMDMKSDIVVRTGSAATPTYAAYQGAIYQYSFGTAGGDTETFHSYHFDHDYAPATDVYIHAHWSVIAAPTGNVNWLFDLIYAKGYNQGPFEGTAGSALPVTVGVTRAGGTAFYHQIAEVVCSASGGLISSAINVSITSGLATMTAASSLFSSADIGKTVRVVGAGAAGGNLDTTISAYGSATSVTLADAASTTVTTQPNFRWRVLDSDLFQTDGVLLARCWRNSARTADTLNVAPFLHYVDCHYQSTGIPTKQRNGPDFWT